MLIVKLLKVKKMSRNFVYLEFTDEKVKNEFAEKIRKFLGKGINAVCICESKEELINELSEGDEE